MLLTCCFRDQKTKKHKKNDSRKSSIGLGNEDVYSKELSVSSTTLRPGSSQARKLERYPPSKEERRLIKQRSQESLGQRIPDNHPDHSRSTLENISRIHSRKESLPSPPATPQYQRQDGRRSSLAQHSLLSSTNILESSPPYKQGGGPLLTSTPATTAGASSSSTSSITPSNTSVEDSISRNPAGAILPEIKRSSGFYSGQFLEQQIKDEEEQIEKMKKNEELVEETKKSYSMKIQKLKEDHMMEIKKAQADFESELKASLQALKEDNDKLMTKAKNEANDKITRLNQQIVVERAKMISEQQEISRNLEAEYRIKEEGLNDSIQEIENREKVWQEERADILKEVQRLKAEATRMVKILALEYEEDDNISEEKKRSLSQEVYSLQLVVEMRTGEVRNMREQMAKATQQLEQADIDKQRLKKVTARMEDLEEQLRIKNQFERQLSLEKKELELSVTSSKKAAQRMSQNVEELQWRIKNNFDLPVEHYHNHTIVEQEQQVKLETERTNTHSNSGLSIQSAPLPIPKQKCLFAVSPEMLEATSFNETNCDEGKTSDFSPSSGEAIEFPESEEEVMEYQHDSEIDGDSLDEGLGDISSDETTELLVPEREESIKSDTHDIFQSQAIEVSAKSPIIEKERRPSRISFETPL